jgi:phosphoribosylformylglycinamidine synthase
MWARVACPTRFPELVHGGGAGGHFDLRAIPSEEPGMTPMQIWCNEAQERYVLAIHPDRPGDSKICERERCPYAVIGVASTDHQLVVEDPLFHDRPVDMALPVLLGEAAAIRHVEHRSRAGKLDASAIDLADAALRTALPPSPTRPS